MRGYMAYQGRKDHTHNTVLSQQKATKASSCNQLPFLANKVCGTVSGTFPYPATGSFQIFDLWCLYFSSPAVLRKCKHTPKHIKTSIRIVFSMDTSCSTKTYRTLQCQDLETSYSTRRQTFQHNIQISKVILSHQLPASLSQGPAQMKDVFFFCQSHLMGKSDSRDQKQQEPGKPTGSFSPSEAQYSTMHTEKLEQLERTPETFHFFSTWAQRACPNFTQQVYKKQSPVSTGYLIRMAQILVISILSSLVPLGRN